jgi:hypothetical protein
MSDEMDVCGICQDEDSKQIKLPCQGCGFLFCEICVLYWKITKDECPRRCCSPWRIELPPQRDQTIARLQVTASLIHNESTSKQFAESLTPTERLDNPWAGFIQCPRCSRLGCLHCSNIACRRKLSFADIDVVVHGIELSYCSICPDQKLRLFRSIDHCHPPCTNSNPLYYLKCTNCEQKFCC